MELPCLVRCLSRLGRAGASPPPHETDPAHDFLSGARSDVAARAATTSAWSSPASQEYLYRRVTDPTRPMGDLPPMASQSRPAAGPPVGGQPRRECRARRERPAPFTRWPPPACCRHPRSFRRRRGPPGAAKMTCCFPSAPRPRARAGMGGPLPRRKPTPCRRRWCGRGAGRGRGGSRSPPPGRRHRRASTHPPNVAPTPRRHRGRSGGTHRGCVDHCPHPRCADRSRPPPRAVRFSVSFFFFHCL